MQVTEEQPPSSRSPSNIRTMFNGIAHTYDFLNHLMSFGMDIRWRKKAVSFLAEKRGGIFLDIAAGSGDVTLEIFRTVYPLRVVAADFAVNMFNVFSRKIDSNESSRAIDFVSCDALRLPFQDQIFDGTIVAFGIRNFADRLRSLQEMQRVLKLGGMSVVLELTEPTIPFAAQCYHLYSRIGISLLGRIVSHHNTAYKYLPESISEFPSTEEFLSLMSKAGFSDTKAELLSLGAATVFVGRKK